jgi:lysophospholipase L1-like esterase
MTSTAAAGRDLQQHAHEPAELSHRPTGVPRRGGQPSWDARLRPGRLAVLRVLAAGLALASAGACTAGRPSGTAGDRPPPPRVMAALGDSITRAYAACGRAGDCVEMSWATGTAEDLESHAQRLDVDQRVRSHNLAVSGAQVAGLATQVQAAVRTRPDYVTVLIGANDACAPDEAAMTSVEEYTEDFDRALDALVRGLPHARVLVLSIPDLARLWQVGKDQPDVRRVWATYGICQSMLADPSDDGARAQARRDRVRARTRAYNAAMAAACDRHAPQCRHDRNAVADHRFSLDDVSPADYWHPSRHGQATLAEVSWRAGFWS